MTKEQQAIERITREHLPHLREWSSQIIDIPDNQFRKIHDDVLTLRTHAESLERELVEARKVLRGIEWAAGMKTHCPSCNALKYMGHVTGCELAASIPATMTPTPPTAMKEGGGE